ncbi:MAG: futalosine hydrolase [Chitinophagaceae bacterium]|nr:futalosine hydrolase [Chitinophagaceae bacterium]
MKILVAAATALEIPSFVNNTQQADVLITGVGLPLTLYSLQKRLSQINYDLVIQAGIAGAFTNEFNLGETVLVKQDTFGDIGFEETEIFTPFFETTLFNKNEFPFEDGWLLNKNKLLTQSNLELVKAITVNKISDNIKTKAQQENIFNAEIETMEGAALHYVCLQENIPFIQLRSISNYVGERNKAKWKMEEAISNLNIELSKLINELT